MSLKDHMLKACSVEWPYWEAVEPL
jgi:hypothetical protein